MHERRQEQPQILRLRYASLRMTNQFGANPCPKIGTWGTHSSARAKARAAADSSTPLRCAQNDKPIWCDASIAQNDKPIWCDASITQNDKPIWCDASIAQNDKSSLARSHVPKSGHGAPISIQEWAGVLRGTRSSAGVGQLSQVPKSGHGAPVPIQERADALRSIRSNTRAGRGFAAPVPMRE